MKPGKAEKAAPEALGVPVFHDFCLLWAVCEIIRFCRKHESVQDLASSSLQKCVQGKEEQEAEAKLFFPGIKALEMSCKNIDWDTDNSILRDFRVPIGPVVLLPCAVS